ncbi:tonB-system energizer ExbB [Paracoccus sp. DMF-8]|uniref:tonB-system energizer ExbB n=1 Tax=Paracoccus sp. DMF-8 TaxID=3019445 RepID=UPI0023E8BC73|nr:tonB-system energizer ExbB [Paracoccus sp. DMF-8]MDF3604835.1 tonB-system energizer ExbB [Paracoccus sp. DMF-8]
MTNQRKSRKAANIQAMTLACLLMAATPLAAQETTLPEPQGTATESTQTTPDTAAPQAAPEAAAPAASAPAAPAATTPATPPVTTAPAAGTPAETGAETPAAQTPAAQTPAAETTPAASTGTAPAAVAPAATETPAPAATTPAAPAATTPAAGEAPATPAADAAATGAAAPSGETAADAAASTATPAAPAAEPAEAEDAAPSFLPESVQRALDPVLNPPARDPNLPHDLSPVGMFIAADIVVKAVMIGLAFASVVTWTVLVMKVLELMGASGRVARARRIIEDSADLPQAAAATKGRGDPASRMVRAAMAEYERSAPSLVGRQGDDGLKERVHSRLGQIEGQAGRSISRGTGLLATIGSTAPFVGLFGTVWGIMNSFISISESQTTNLAVVAPGIAEALLATAIGLVAAIPAVVIYNVFARAITGYRMKLSAAGAGIQRLVSRDLDFRGV